MSDSFKLYSELFFARPLGRGHFNLVQIYLAFGDGKTYDTKKVKMIWKG